jgi:hypothetical protein
MSNLADVNPTNPMVYNPITLGPVAAADALGFGNHDTTAKDKARDYGARNTSLYQAGNPYWQGQGRDSDAKTAAYDGFYQSYGRAPTTDELNQILPSFLGSDAHVTDVAGGNAFVSQMHQASENTPAKIYERQQQQWKAGANKYYDQVAQTIQGLFGRAPTQDELDHYGTALASGQVDAYTIGEFLKSLPEYQDARDKEFRSGVDSQLQDSDQKFFGRAKEDVISRYAQMGRPTSPALDVALTEFASQLSERRGTYMAQLSANQYGGNKAAAQGQYESDRQDYMNRGNQNIGAQYDQYQDLLKRSRDISDYNRQSEDYSRNLDRYGPGRDAGPLDYLNTGLNTLNTGVNIYKNL